MKFSSRPQQKGHLGGALPGTWNRPALMCNCLMEQLGVLSESSKPLQLKLSVSDQHFGVSVQHDCLCRQFGKLCLSAIQDVVLFGLMG